MATRAPEVVAILFLMVAACGGDEATAPPPAPTATTAPPTQAPEPTATPVPAAPAASGAMESPHAAYAAELVGGPGSIYVGDLTQLVGPAPDVALGDFDGNVTLEALQLHSYVFESEYYQTVLERANLIDPTPLVSEGEEFEIQYACINRALLWCTLKEKYMFPRVLERTNGQLKLVTTSFPELGLAGPDVHTLVADGTLGMADIAQYIAGAFPAIEIGSLFGIYPTLEHNYIAMANITPELRELAVESTEGGQLHHPELAFREQRVLLQQGPAGHRGVLEEQENPHAHRGDVELAPRHGGRRPVHGLHRGLHRIGARYP